MPSTGLRRGLGRGLSLGLRLTLGTLALSLPNSASAQTLNEALSGAYLTNPQLQAERARQRATDEEVARALGGFRPVVSLTGELGVAVDQFETPARTTTQHRYPAQIGLQLRQPIYDGGRSYADVERTEAAVLRGRALLASTEQTVLTDAVAAFHDLYRDQTIADLTAENVRWLEEQVVVAKRRYAVNDITVTDVVQAEARYARGIADHRLAEGNLAAARSNYERVVGTAPGRPEAPPPLLAALPESLEQALDAAVRNPDLAAAQWAEKIAVAEVDFVSSALRPSVSVRANARRNAETDQPDLTRNTAEVSLQVSVPLYEGGVDYARTRGAKHTVSQRRLDLERTRRTVHDQVQRGWEGVVTARSRIVSLEKQIDAAETAVRAVRQEVRVGARSLLDQLNAQLEFLDARIALTRSQRDEAVASYNLLAATGQLTAGFLGLDVPLHDATGHFDRTRGRWFGTSVEDD